MRKRKEISKQYSVVIVGGGNSAAADALILSRIAKKVILIHRRDSLRATKVYHESLEKAENVEFLWENTVSQLLFGEKLNIYQWIGVLLTLMSIFLMSRAGKKEDIDFKSNKWIWCLAGAVLMGAVSGLYDKFIMKSLSPMFVQSWFNFYQMIIMAVICGLLWYPKRHQSTPFKWRWSIPLISLFICIADFAYFTSLNDSESMISVVSLVRRSSVIVSFACAILIFKERNLRAKIVDLGLILLGMAFIWMGTDR